MGRMANPEEIGKSIAFVGECQELVAHKHHADDRRFSERVVLVYYRLAVDRGWGVLVSHAL
jgi:hypothetical protein